MTVRTLYRFGVQWFGGDPYTMRIVRGFFPKQRQTMSSDALFAVLTAGTFAIGRAAAMQMRGRR